MIGARLLRTARLMAPAASACACAAVVSEYRRAESAAAPLPKVHLHYFGLQGVAETVRHVMALGEMEWTESKWAVDFKKVDMKDVANTLPIASPGFAEAQKTGVLDPNMRRAPVARATRHGSHQATICLHCRTRTIRQLAMHACMCIPE